MTAKKDVLIMSELVLLSGEQTHTSQLQHKIMGAT